MHINQLDCQSLNQPSCIDTPMKLFKNIWSLYCPVLGQCSRVVATHRSSLQRNTLEKLPNKSSLTETCTRLDTRDGHYAQLPQDFAYLHLHSALSQILKERSQNTFTEQVYLLSTLFIIF